MNSSKILLMVLIMAASMISESCETEPLHSNGIPEDNKVGVLQKIENDFNWSQFSQVKIKSDDDARVLWDHYSLHNENGVEWYEFAIESHEFILDEVSKVSNITYSLLVTKTENKELKYYLNKMTSYNGDPYSSYFELESKWYTGMTYLYNQHGELAYMQYYRKGKLVSAVADEQINATLPSSLSAQCTQKGGLTARCESTTTCDPPVAPSCGGAGGGSTGGHYELMYTGYYTDWYQDRNGNGTAEASEYSNTDFEGYSSEWVWVPGSTTGPLYNSSWNYNMYYAGSGYANLNYNPQAKNPLPELIVELLTFDGNPCIRPIVKKLQEKDHSLFLVPDISQGASHLTQTILDIFDASQEYRLDIVMEQLGTDSNGNQINGRTVPMAGGWKIKLDKDLMNNGTQLSIAKTLIHETLHAFLKYSLDKNRGSDLAVELQALYNSYINEPREQQQSLTHHQFFAQYVEAMARSLSIWDGNRLPMEYYKKLSWGGLETSTAYQDKSQSEKNQIQKAIKDERFNRSGAQGTPCD